MVHRMDFKRGNYWKRHPVLGVFGCYQTYWLFPNPEQIYSLVPYLLPVSKSLQDTEASSTRFDSSLRAFAAEASGTFLKLEALKAQGSRVRFRVLGPLGKDPKPSTPGFSV